jgi:hypothetical protein
MKTLHLKFLVAILVMNVAFLAMIAYMING